MLNYLFLYKCRVSTLHTVTCLASHTAFTTCDTTDMVSCTYTYMHRWCYSGALTARPLRTSELFTIELSGRPALSFGITVHGLVIFELD